MSQNNNDYSLGGLFNGGLGVMGVAGAIVAIGALIMAFKNPNRAATKDPTYEVRGQGQVATDYVCQVPSNQVYYQQPTSGPQYTYNLPPQQPPINPQPVSYQYPAQMPMPSFTTPAVPAPPIVQPPVYQAPPPAPAPQPMYQAQVAPTYSWGPSAYVATVASYVPQPMSYAPVQNPQMYGQQLISRGDTMADRYKLYQSPSYGYGGYGGSPPIVYGTTPQSSCPQTLFYQNFTDPALWNTPKPIGYQTTYDLTQHADSAYARTYPNGSVSFVKIPAVYGDNGTWRV